MRMQEGPQRKRLRLDDSEDEDFEAGSSASEDEVDEAGRGREDESGSGEECEDGEEEGFGHSGDESDVSQRAAPPISLPEDEDEDANSRFGSSRITFKPRAANPHTQHAAPQSSKPLPTSYESMGISSVLVSALAKMSIRTPTEIQAACIPPLLAGEYTFI